jgi:hypothetical protein
MLQVVHNHITERFVPFQQQLKVSDFSAQLLNYVVLSATAKAVRVLREHTQFLLLTCKVN